LLPLNFTILLVRDESPMKAHVLQDMVEESALSYYEFLLHIQQVKMKKLDLVLLRKS
jgi:hypothetical protein